MFEMYLNKNDTIENIIVHNFIKEYDKELDNEVSVVLDICDIFSEYSNIEFVVSGFGLYHWNVDCWLDLPCIIEQLPDIIKKINNDDYNFELDFFEQGTECTIFFEEKSDSIQLKCISKTDWVPTTEFEYLTKEEVKNIFIKLSEDFIVLANEYCSNLIHEPMFSNWWHKI